MNDETSRLVFTKVKINEEDRQKLTELVAMAQRMPVIAFSSKDAIEGRDLSSIAWREAVEFAHQKALEAGLPEIPGYYGVTQDGEFCYYPGSTK